VKFTSILKPKGQKRARGRAFWVGGRALAGEIRPATQPDLDNRIKNLKDVCQGVFWLDDRQVAEHRPGTGKYLGDLARGEIEIETLATALWRGWL
jgi:Holliday junction resolvase RusA-like endonuclease